MKPPANIFLLTHKCGNHYFQRYFGDKSLPHFQSDDIKGEMPGPYIGESIIPDREFLNIRCRNFDSISISRLLKSIDLEKSRFFLMTRHPNSFFRSATSYHLRGGEKWARTNRYSYLKNKTLHEALCTTEDPDQRLLISMKHFGLAWRLLDRWIQNHRFLSSLGAKLFIIKTEDLFSTTSRDYFYMLSEKMSHNSYSANPERLMSCSPAFMEKLPKHSTGEFKKSHFSGYGDKAREFYNDNFLNIQQYFYCD